MNLYTPDQNLKASWKIAQIDTMHRWILGGCKHSFNMEKDEIGVRQKKKIIV